MGSLLSIDDALAAIAAEVRALVSECVPIADAAGRYLAEPLVAAGDLPPFTNSAMDGYAFRAADGVGPFAVVGESAAGVPFDGHLERAQAVLISTGAVMPTGADTVAPVEVTDATAGRRAVTLQRELQLGANVRLQGSDVVAGDEILPPGTALGPGQIGAAAAVGVPALRCGRRPRVAVISTGTELRPVGEPLAEGQIHDSNGPLLAAAVARAGGLAASIAATEDTVEAHEYALVQGLAYDVVLTAGGVSVGPHDLVREVQRKLGVQERFWRVAMRPGKPLSFGVHERDPDGHRTLLFGLPGNPVSVMVCFELFVAPALRALQGAANPGPNFRRVVLSADARRNPERDDLIRARLDPTGATAIPLTGQQSHQIAVSSRADGVVRIPTGTGELAAGSAVDFMTL